MMINVMVGVQVEDVIRVAREDEVRCASCCDIYTNDNDDLKLWCPIHEVDIQPGWTCPEHLFYRKEEEE